MDAFIGRINDQAFDIFHFLVAKVQNNSAAHAQTMHKDASIALYGDRIVFDEGTENQMDLPFSQTDAVTVLGRNKLNIYFGKDIFQLKGSKRFNALKYVNIFFRYQHIQRGEENGKFLGL